MTFVATSDWPDHFPKKYRGDDTSERLCQNRGGTNIQQAWLGQELGIGHEKRFGAEWGLVDIKDSNILRR